MKAQLEKQLEELKEALRSNLITVNEYQDMYYSISKKIKGLN